MGFFYTVTAKEQLEARNKIILQRAIPSLLKSGFRKSPFSGSWYGRNNLNDYNYELCRLSSNAELEIVEIYIAKDDSWIKIYLNIFKLDPSVNTIEQLNGVDGIQFKLPQNSLTNLHFRSDDIKGPPIFSLNYMYGHKLRRSYTKYGLDRNISRLEKTIENDLNNIGRFIKRWHGLHRPMATSWAGHPVGTEPAKQKHTDGTFA